MGRDVVLLFAGQGAQAVGMGADLMQEDAPTRERFETASALLGYDLAAVMRDGPIEELTRTSRCQPALYLHGLSCWDLLRQRVPDLNVVACAGLSLGEFTAHAVAGTYEPMAGLELVAKRGLFMEQAAQENDGSMAAMIGGDDRDIEALAKECGVEVANYNAPGQTVLSGPREGIRDAISKGKSYGVMMATELQVAGAYHSRLMRGAQEKLSETLAKVPMKIPECPVICNLEAREVSSPADIRDTLTKQVTGSVRWSASMSLLLARGHRTFVELGPGGVLAGLMRRIDRSVKVMSARDWATIGSTAERLNGSS